MKFFSRKSSADPSPTHPAPPPHSSPPAQPTRHYGKWMVRTLLYGTLGAILVCCAGWGLKLACWGNNPAGQLGVDPIRFGPNNTNGIP